MMSAPEPLMRKNAFASLKKASVLGDDIFVFFFLFTFGAYIFAKIKGSYDMMIPCI
jgi:hypothetical protein